MTSREREVLTALLGAEFSGVEDLRRQAGSAQVVDMCKCGCPTIHFAVGQENGRNRLVAEATASDGQSEVLLFITDSGLDSLEFVSTTDRRLAEFPAAESLSVTVR